MKTTKVFVEFNGARRIIGIDHVHDGVLAEAHLDREAALDIARELIMSVVEEDISYGEPTYPAAARRGAETMRSVLSKVFDLV